MIRLNGIKTALIGTVTSTLLLALSNAHVALAVTGTTSSSSTLPIYQTQWGGDSVSDGQFKVPRGMAFDDDGNVYIADAGTNDRIQKFTAKGVFLAKWGGTGTGDGQFNDPYDVAIDSGGNVYVADAGNDRIQKFAPDGTFVAKWALNGGNHAPASLAISSDDVIYVADVGFHQIQEFTTDGTFLGTWGSNGSANGQFNSPNAVAIDSSDNIYVADMNNHRVQKFTSDGVFIDTWGSNGANNGQFITPHDIAVDNNGNVYVADTGNERIQKFTSDGIFVTTWGSSGAGAGQFNGIHHLGVDSKSSVYAADIFNFRVQKFAYPQNLGTVTAAGSSSLIELALPEGSNITAIESITNTEVDGAYSYPLGLIDFTFEATAIGATSEVILSFETDLKPDDVTARKYDSTTQAYADIENVAITETTVNGSPGLRVVYEITDGGPLDEDSVANGVIVDPIGLATVQASSSDVPEGDTPRSGTPGAPDTGYGSRPTNPLYTLAGFIVSALTLLGLSATIRKLIKTKVRGRK